MGLKPHDRFTVPLCRKHHREQEGRTDAFCVKYQLDLWARAATLANNSPDTAMKAAMKDAE